LTSPGGLCRGVVSNAIVLVKNGMEIGLGSGQTSRVDAARQAVAKAVAFQGPDALKGAACGSDAFYPFPDAVQVCLDAGVTAFAQPGGSIHDTEAIDAAEKAGASMLYHGRSPLPPLNGAGEGMSVKVGLAARTLDDSSQVARPAGCGQIPTRWRGIALLAIARRRLAESAAPTARRLHWPWPGESGRFPMRRHWNTLGRAAPTGSLAKTRDPMEPRSLPQGRPRRRRASAAGRRQAGRYARRVPRSGSSAYLIS